MVQETSHVSKSVVCPQGQGGLSQCGRFAGKGGGSVNFSRFCVDVLYGRPLITTHELNTFKLKQNYCSAVTSLYQFMEFV